MMTHPKPKPKRSKPHPDPTVATLAEIVQSEGLDPSPTLLNKLLLFWVKSAADAQVRGARIAKEVKKEE